ncbi:3-hydroxyacyl-CoA dehydrogenase [Amycolatopsis acidicola]|uniref:3-hydroxyacyl-CoA dehydrogenase n=1 Tax=Amycolatopsis acidicola TaxID=2596893 RepID=A0A5N0VML6_9PSEU|nr:3-hydroxyacyl-CoA dehydrogenase NAD-binding domain-containing protein [Amycolatopsis acidicola]KAA9166410.1 3-hydroxyacyl-CoA dehydrogenase [Amycolatopsis acidicola]
MRMRMIGTGVMGRGIAQWAATAGHTVELADARQESVGEAVEFIRSMLDRAVQKGRTTAEDAAAISGRLVPLDSPGQPGDVDLVIEAVREDLGTKAELFAELEKALPERTVFASNTSSLPITRIAATLRDPSRLVGLHFFNPAPLMKIVEVIPGTFTRPEIVEQVSGLVRDTGHEAVVVSDTPGFLINHAGRGLVTEALALLEEGAAEPVVIDRIARDVLGLKMGPFELMDLTGLDVTATVIESIWEGFRYADRLRASYLTPNRVAAGLHGRKTGRGWYDHNAETPPEQAISGDASRPVWSPDAAVREALAGATIAEGGIVLVPTWGTTVASAIAAGGLPPERTFGVDPLSLPTGRRVLAVTPASDVTAARDAAAVLSLGDKKVSVVRDVAGGVAQRLVASIVGVAAAIAEHGIASPGDIDLGVTRGLGYPVGPLAWGDRLGASRVLALQTALHETTGDPRYRPTRWITERAQLGLPLTAAGLSPADL